MKMFISHSATDKKVLGDLKRDLFICGINCFLAHDDITPGEHDLERIKKEIANCDIFLIVGNKEAKDSIYCNQEIGMAIAHKKPIISTIDNTTSSWGFIARQQAIKYKNIQQLFPKLIKEIIFSSKYKQYWKKEKQCLQKLKIKGFAINRAKAKFISIYPKYNRLSQGNPTLWNDYGYYTEFEIWGKQEKIGEVKIGYQGQTPSTPKTIDKLPKYFPFLKNKFFCRCFFNDDISDIKEKALCFLLNSIKHNQASAKKYINEDVVEKSLFRQEHDNNHFEKIKQKILNN